VLNLPDTIQFVAGHQNYYTYDASGKKLEVQNITSRNILNLPQDTITRLVSSTKLTTDYCGDAIYQNDTLKEVLTPEGYWQNGLYYYYLKDHQGNNRVVINSSGVVQEYSDYYPDGMRFESSTSNSAALPYRYNGKELEAMNGLNEYDYGARRRETGIPVWTTIDPLCEKYYGMSPYTYCTDNPIRFIDPNGKWLGLPSLDEIAKKTTQTINFIATTVSRASTSYATEVSKTANNANNVTQKITGHPLVSETATITTLDKRTILSLPSGDKISTTKSVLTTTGKGNGLINVDVATSQLGDKTATVSTILGNSVSVNSNGMIGIGQSIANTTVQTSTGLGVGLGEHSWGFSQTSNGVTTGQELDVRPGGGTLIGAGLIMGSMALPEIFAPFDAAVLKYVTK